MLNFKKNRVFILNNTALLSAAVIGTRHDFTWLTNAVYAWLLIAAVMWIFTCCVLGSVLTNNKIPPEAFKQFRGKTLPYGTRGYVGISMGVAVVLGSMVPAWAVIYIASVLLSATFYSAVS